MVNVRAREQVPLFQSILSIAMYCIAPWNVVRDSLPVKSVVKMNGY